MEVLRATTAIPSSPTFSARRCLLCRADFACRLDDGTAWEEGRSDMKKLSIVVDAVMVLAVAGPQWWSRKLLCHSCDLALDEISRALSHRVAIRRCFLANVAQLHGCDVIAPPAPQDTGPRSVPAPPHATVLHSDGIVRTNSDFACGIAENAADVPRCVERDVDSDSCTLGLHPTASDKGSGSFEANPLVSPHYQEGTPLGKNGDGAATEVTALKPTRPDTVTNQGHITISADCQGRLGGFKDAESTNYAERQQCRGSYPDRCQQSQKRKSASREQLLDEANGRPVRKLSKLLETLSAAASAAAAAAAAASLTSSDGDVSPRASVNPGVTPLTKPAEQIACEKQLTGASDDSHEADTSASTVLRRLSSGLDLGNTATSHQAFLGANSSSSGFVERDDDKAVAPRPHCNVPCCSCGSSAADLVAAVPAAEHAKTSALESCNGSSKSCALARTSAISTGRDGHMLSPPMDGVGRGACQYSTCGNGNASNKRSTEHTTTGCCTNFEASDARPIDGRSRMEAEIDKCTCAEFSQNVLLHQQQQRQQLKEHPTQCHSSTGFTKLLEPLRMSPTVHAGSTSCMSCAQHAFPRPRHLAMPDAPERWSCVHQAKSVAAPCALAVPSSFDTRSGVSQPPVASMSATGERAEHTRVLATVAVLPKHLTSGHATTRDSHSSRAVPLPTSGAHSSASSSASSDLLSLSSAAGQQASLQRVASTDVAQPSAVRGKPATEVTTVQAPPQPYLQPAPQTSSPKLAESAGNLVCHAALLAANRNYDIQSCSERLGAQAEVVLRSSAVLSPSSEQKQCSESPPSRGEAKSDPPTKPPPDVPGASISVTGLAAASETDRLDTLSPQTKVSCATKQGPLKLPDRGSAMTTLWKLLQQPTCANHERGSLGSIPCTIGFSVASDHTVTAGKRGVVDTKTCHSVDLAADSALASGGVATSSAAQTSVATAASSLRGGAVHLSHLLRGAAARALVDAPLSAVRGSSDGDCQRPSPGVASCNSSSSATGSATPLLAGMFEKLSESPLPLPTRRLLSTMHSGTLPAIAKPVGESHQLPKPGHTNQVAAIASRASPEFGRRLRRYSSNPRHSRFPNNGVGLGSGSSGGLNHSSFANDPCRRRLIRTASVHRPSPNVFGVRLTGHHTFDSAEEFADACEDEPDCSGFAMTESETSYGQQHQAYAAADAAAGARGSSRNGQALVSPPLKELKTEPLDV